LVLDVADRLLVIEKGRFVKEVARADADAARLGGYLSI
jgi:ABC-type sugar transport system ATPase subunit